MRYRVNIIEPWESGTDRSIDANIVKYTCDQFLLFTEKKINVKGNDAQYFICKLKSEKLRSPFNNKESGIYEISMVFDKDITNELQELPDIENYRGNFLTGELII